MSDERVDKVLVAVQLAPTRSQALQLIQEKVVFYNNKLVTKPSTKILDKDLLEVRKDMIFVGRGAHKIEGAHQKFAFSFEHKVIADVGASTGGFTQYALLSGASKVFAIDVGHHQLSPLLRSDERVINMEGTNIRDLKSLPEPVDFAVVDLSFISLRLVSEQIVNLVKDGGEVLFLVKPQFEVGKEMVGKNGLVKSEEAIQKTLKEIESFFKSLKLDILGKMKCTIKGKTGNQEFLYYCRKS